ncbi:MAG: amidohydrolase [Gemmatimonadales bacterium]|nr:amidohydrolase [Gemmatimonadales bacterium]
MRIRPADSTASLAFIHATVIDVETGKLRVDMTVLVSANRIASVESSGVASFPMGTHVIDGRGKYLVPGLWDMHVHAFTSPESTLTLGARATDVYFPQFLAAGVTGIRDMGGWVDTVMGVRRRVRNHEVLGPRIVAAGRLFGGKNPWAPSSPHVWVVTTPDSARFAVDSMKRAGADFIKVHDFLSRDVYLAIAAAARAAALPLVGHLQPRVKVADAIAAGQIGMEHMPIELIVACAGGGTSEVNAFYDQWRKGGWPEFVRGTAALWRARKPANCAETMGAMKSAGVHLTPTLVLRMHDSTLYRRVPVADLTLAAATRCSEDVNDWSKTPDSLRTLYYTTVLDVVRVFHEAGVGILAGTDGPGGCLVPGWALHEELENFVKAGLSPLQALQTATIEPARFMGMSDSLGTVEAGKVADLVLLDANPLADVRNTRRVAGVVVDGRWQGRDELRSLSARARHSLSNQTRSTSPGYNPPNGRSNWTRKEPGKFAGLFDRIN